MAGNPAVGRPRQSQHRAASEQPASRPPGGVPATGRGPQQIGDRDRTGADSAARYVLDRVGALRAGDSQRHKVDRLPRDDPRRRVQVASQEQTAASTEATVAVVEEEGGRPARPAS